MFTALNYIETEHYPTAIRLQLFFKLCVLIYKSYVNPES